MNMPRTKKTTVKDHEHIDMEIMSPSPGKPAPSWAIDPGTLSDAIRIEINKARKSGDEAREYAARALLACLRVGHIDQVADALIEHFVEIEDDDE
jgi:hypothetical protein